MMDEDTKVMQYAALGMVATFAFIGDRKSTRLNSSH